MSIAVSRNEIDWGLSYGRRDESLAVGQEAVYISRQLTQLRQHVDKPISLGWRDQLKNRIEDMKTAYSQQGWDGYEAEPVSQVAAMTAEKFSEILPENIEMPDLTPENDGGLSFDWNKGKNLIFSVSASGQNIIYAGIVAGERLHGEIPIQNELPEQINRVLTRYFSRKD